MIDKIKGEQKVPLKTKFTDDRVMDAMDAVALEKLETLNKKLEIYTRLREIGLTESERQDLEKLRIEVFQKKIEAIMWRMQKETGGCYPASATFVDVAGRRRQMESLLLGEEVQSSPTKVSHQSQLSPSSTVNQTFFKNFCKSRPCGTRRS